MIVNHDSFISNRLLTDWIMSSVLFIRFPALTLCLRTPVKPGLLLPYANRQSVFSD